MFRPVMAIIRFLRRCRNLMMAITGRNM